MELASVNRSSLNPGTLLALTTTSSGRNAHKCTSAAFEKVCLNFFQVCHIFIEIGEIVNDVFLITFFAPLMILYYFISYPFSWFFLR